jgi:diguanylate cyclase (GGDEF)-like protein
MPRLTSRVFADLAVWMVGFGLSVGLVFPPFCLLLGLPQGTVLTPLFFGSTLVAGVAVGSVNFALARLVVGRRFAALARGMHDVEAQLAAAAYSQDWASCDPGQCALPVDSDDEVGTTAAAFNRLVRTLARSHAIETAMRQFSAVLSREYEVDGLGMAALGGLLHHLGASAGAILLTRDGELQLLATHGLRDASAIADNDHVRAALRAQSLSRIRIDDGSLVVDSLLLGQSPREVLVAPITFKGLALGVIVVATTTAFRPDDVALLEQFRSDLGLAFNNALVHDRLEHLAAVDPLTDAYNRRFGLARLREEFARAVRAESPLGLLMLDIDHFKAVNDTYGHLVGDRVLRGVAECCRRVLRDGDVLVRYGGEEFLVILPGAGADDVAKIGERLRHAIRETTARDGDRLVRVTVSLGGARYRADTESPDALVLEADQALYRAKAEGRDRLVAA